jgi:sigma-B regulation protein RsbU (phosphoserine phosphatase)
MRRRSSWPARRARAALRPGTTIVCFTDGLYERRTAPIDEQLERLRTAVTSDRPEAVCSNVMATMVGSHRVEDDTALLALTRTR